MLATVDDVEDRLGRPLTDDEIVRADALLQDVDESVKLYTGQRYERADYTFKARARGGYVRLPQRPVHSVDSVTRDDDDVTFTFDGIDRVYTDCLLDETRRPPILEITYDAGPETPPRALVGVVCNIVLRALGRDPLDGGTIREQIDNYSYSLGSASGAGAYGLLPDEMRILNSFRRPASSIRTMA